MSRLEEIKELSDPSKIKQYYHNLSQDHQKALIALRKDRSLTIKTCGQRDLYCDTRHYRYLREAYENWKTKRHTWRFKKTRPRDSKRSQHLITDCQMKRRLLSVFEKVKYTTDLSEVRPQRLYWLRKVHKNTAPTQTYSSLLLWPYSEAVSAMQQPSQGPSGLSTVACEVINGGHQYCGTSESGTREEERSDPGNAGREGPLSLHPPWSRNHHGSPAGATNITAYQL